MESDELAHRLNAVVKDFGGIVPYAEAFYLESIIYAAERADAAFEAFDLSFNSNDPNAMAFALLQEGLTYSAALSKFFWTHRNTALAVSRGEKLRAAFRLTDTSPLKDRRLRNSLEHFDERLDSFLLEENSGLFQPSPLVGKENDPLQGTAKRFKFLDPDQGVCIILGERFFFRPLCQEVRTVMRTAIDMFENGGRLL